MCPMHRCLTRACAVATAGVAPETVTGAPAAPPCRLIVGPELALRPNLIEASVAVTLLSDIGFHAVKQSGCGTRFTLTEGGNK
jgi:hypothetical protein